MLLQIKTFELQLVPGQNFPNFQFFNSLASLLSQKTFHNYLKNTRKTLKLALYRSTQTTH